MREAANIGRAAGRDGRSRRLAGAAWATLWRAGVVSVVLTATVQAFARAAWAVAGHDAAAFAQAAQAEPPERRPVEAGAVHAVYDWPADRPRDFTEAPRWRAAVEAGALPTVGERLPARPLIVRPPHQEGPYGGTWRRLGTGPADVGVFEDRIAYEGPVRWDAMGREVLPNLATSWEVQDGGRAFLMRLREGVRWSDGEPFDAQDLAFWHEHVLLNRELTPSVPAAFAPGGEPMGLEVLGPHEVRFTFAEPHGLFLYQLASGWGHELASYPAHYLRQFHPAFADVADLRRAARSRGFDLWTQLFADVIEWRNPEMPRLWAWVVTQAPPARPTIFERNPYYWKVDSSGRQLPYIDRVTFDIYSTDTINLKALQGETGMQHRHITSANYPLLMERGPELGYAVRHWIDGTGGGMLCFNLNHRDPAKRAVFADRRFRIAVSHALDREAMSTLGTRGLAVPQQMSPPPSSPFHDPAYTNAYLEHSPRRANALLDEMGLAARDDEGYRLLPDGRRLDIVVEFVQEFQALEVLAENLKAVGLRARVQVHAVPLFYTRLEAMLHDVAAWGGSDEQVPILDPEYYVPLSKRSYHAVAYGQWTASGGARGERPTEPMLRCLALYDQLRQTPDLAEQKRLFAQILDINREHLWTVGTVGQNPVVVVVPEEFANVPEVAMGGWIFRTPGNTAPECYAIDPSRLGGKAGG